MILSYGQHQKYLVKMIISEFFFFRSLRQCLFVNIDKTRIPNPFQRKTMT